MGCGQTLFVGSGGYLTCSWIECPRPDAVSDLLDDDETQHLVTFGPHDFTIRHPLRERLDDALMACQLHTYCAELDGPPVQLGRYRAWPNESRWSFTRVPV
jgi:hypothetical protein